MEVITQNIIPFFIILIILMVVHELGHFVTAKLAGVKVLEFGLGLPPKLFGKKVGETEYTINALPIGAFVRPAGEEDPDDPRGLQAQPRWIRFVILSAGALMNVFLAIFLFSLAFMIPREVDISGARIVEVVPDSPAERAGLQSGDEILEVNGRDVQNIGELGYLIRLNLGETVDLTVRRAETTGAELLQIPVYARWSADEYIDPQTGCSQPQGPTGIRIAPAHIAAREPIPLDERRQIAQELPACLTDDGSDPLSHVPTMREIPFTENQWKLPWEALYEGTRRSYETVIIGVKSLISWAQGGVGGGGGFQITGPVGIAQVTGEVVEEAGWRPLIDLAASISISLAVLNLLPLPMLDGGRVVFVLLEWIRGGKRVEPRKEAMVHFAGLVAMLALAVVITYFDILRIFEGRGILR